MASRIKGITVEIGGDTTKLEQSLKSVKSTIGMDLDIWTEKGNDSVKYKAVDTV